MKIHYDQGTVPNSQGTINRDPLRLRDNPNKIRDSPHDTGDPLIIEDLVKTDDDTG